jgi:hypothetical protein
MQHDSTAELETRREVAVVRYVDAMDRGDLDALASILAEAEVDPELDGWIVEVNAALHTEADVGPVSERPGGVLSLLRHMLTPNWERRENMDSVAFLREQILSTREFLEATMADVTTDQARWNAEGRALPIDAQYAHVVFSMDAGLHGLLQGAAPLAAASWAGRTGFASLPPFGPGNTWEQWAQGPFDLAALREYARAVYAATDEYLSELTPDDLARDLDLSSMGLGMRTVGWMLTTGWLLNANMHCGEISCLKGLQGVRGYPM